MYGNDSLLYDVLIRIEAILIRLESSVSFITDNWIPLLFGSIIVVAVVSLLNWLVKL